MYLLVTTDKGKVKKPKVKLAVESFIRKTLHIEAEAGYNRENEKLTVTVRMREDILGPRECKVEFVPYSPAFTPGLRSDEIPYVAKDAQEP